jgi:hypothetical protein
MRLLRCVICTELFTGETAGRCPYCERKGFRSQAQWAEDYRRQMRDAKGTMQDA